MTLRTFPYDTAEFLESEEAIGFFAEAIPEDDEPSTDRKALDVIARSHGFAMLAKRAGLPHRRLVEALRDPETDTFETLKAVLLHESAKASRAAAE